MATNPRIPEQRDVPTLVEQKHKKSAAPWVWFGILAAVILIVAIGFYMPNAPKRPAGPANAVNPAQPAGTQVRFSDIRVSTAPVGGQMYIYARLWNDGNTDIDAMHVNVAFPGQSGQPVHSVTADAESYQDQKPQTLADNPVKPNQSREIRIPIAGVPAGWNHEMPEIKVQDVGGFKK